MTGAFELPREVETAYRAIPQKAATVLAALADGNGLRADQVRLVSGETEISLIPAAITVTLTPDIAKSQTSGQNPQGTVLGSESEVMPQAAALMPAFLQSEGVRQEILETVRRQPGEGFGMAPAALVVKSIHKVFSVLTQCLQCGGTASVPCPPCRGTGRLACQTCRGAGFTKCVVCFGTGMMQDPSGNQVPCTHCQRSGQIVCHACNGLKEMNCQSCGGQGRTACSACAQSGTLTVVYQMSAKAALRFEADWKKLPEEVRQIAEKLGGEKIVARKHAEAYWQLPELRGKDLVIDGLACLPVAKAVFSIAGKSFPATVAGVQGRIVAMEPVLDPFVKPGIAALSKLSKGPLAAEALIATACKIKLVRRVLAEVSRRPKKTVYQALVRDYGAALSDKYARAAVSAASRALQAMSDGPRLKGLALGTALAAGLAAAYYITPLRLRVFALLADRGAERYIGLADIAVGLAGAALAVFTIRLTAAAALKKMLPPAVRAEAASGLPSAGRQGLWAFPAAAAVCVAAAALAAHKPEWILLVLRR